LHDVQNKHEHVLLQDICILLLIHVHAKTFLECVLLIIT